MCPTLQRLSSLNTFQIGQDKLLDSAQREITHLQSDLSNREARVNNLQQELEAAQQLTKEVTHASEHDAAIQRLGVQLKVLTEKNDDFVERANTLLPRYKCDNLVRLSEIRYPRVFL